MGGLLLYGWWGVFDIVHHEKEWVGEGRGCGGGKVGGGGGEGCGGGKVIHKSLMSDA